MIKLNFTNSKVQSLVSFLKKNYLLIFFYPTVIFLHLLFLKLYTAKDILDVFVIISLSNQFDIGLLKNTFFNKQKYNLILLVLIIIFSLVILFCVSNFILYLFNFTFQIKYLLVVLVGLFASEFKSFYDSKSKYFLGFFVKNVLNFSVIYIFYSINSASLANELILVSSFAFLCFLLLYYKLNFPINQSIQSSDFKYFFLNIFTFISGNIDRFLVIPFIALPLRNTYLYFAESNAY